MREPDADAAARQTPSWPDAPGRRIFAYLKRSRALIHVLEALRQCDCPTLVHIEGVPVSQLRRRFDSPALVFEERPLDLRRVGRECDLAVLNGGHGVTAEMLLAGKAVLQVPLVLEQFMTARSVERIGAGVVCAAKTAAEVRAALEDALADGCAAAAGRFAARYESFDPGRQRRAMADRAAELLAAEPACTHHPIAK